MAKTVAAILAEIPTQFPDNTTGLILAANSRTVHTDVTNVLGGLATSIMSYAGIATINDGTTDAGPAFAAAFTALSAAGGGYLFVPQGTYNLVTSVITPPNNVTIQGAGIDATILKCTGSFPNNVPIQIPFTLTGLPWPTGPTTYPINAPTLGASTITTTTAADAGNFAVGNLIFISGDTHGTSFWYPGFYTTVSAVNAGTGLITLAETLPISVGLTRCQKIVSLPQNISIRDMTINNSSGTGAAIECQGGKNFVFENLKIITNNVTTGDVTFGIHKNSILRHIIMEGGAQPIELFVSQNCSIEDCHITNGYILVDGGSFDCSVLNCTVKDPMKNNGSLGSFHGIHIPEYALRNRIIGNSVTGIPGGFAGINISASVDSNRNHIIMGNTLVGTAGSSTGLNTSDGIVIGNFFSNCGNAAIQLQSTEVPIIADNYFDLASPNANNVLPFSGGSFFRTMQEGNMRAMASGTTTPQVAGDRSYTLGQGSAQNVSNFTGAKAGDKIVVVVTDANTTFVSGSGITMKGGVNYNPAANIALQFVALTNTTWLEVSRTA